MTNSVLPSQKDWEALHIVSRLSNSEGPTYIVCPAQKCWRQALVLPAGRPSHYLADSSPSTTLYICESKKRSTLATLWLSAHGSYTHISWRIRSQFTASIVSRGSLLVYNFFTFGPAHAMFVSHSNTMLLKPPRWILTPDTTLRFSFQARKSEMAKKHVRVPDLNILIVENYVP